MSYLGRLGRVSLRGTAEILKLSRIRSSNVRLLEDAYRCFCATLPKSKKETFEVTFVTENGQKLKAKGKVGESLLDVVVNQNVDLDGFGACEGTLACSTCHLVFKPEDYAKLNEKPSDEELDMLDLAYGLCDTSRLGCQVYLTKEMSGMEVKVPGGVNDARGTPT
ncbi:adrenodoxin-like protein 2, mitochondrial [Ornithodoros turicata]|uniref:adrenodoxin-like protein 2, mitochondrial n=1 Tax=Ornithodoros turicata TaxID=34597 RepID=UPI0031390392